VHQVPFPNPLLRSVALKGWGGQLGFPTDEATVFVLLVDERELRALVGGEMVGSLLAGPWKIWVIFALGLNMGVAGVMAGEGAFGGVERVKGGCGCGWGGEEGLHSRCGTDTGGACAGKWRRLSEYFRLDAL
jgi:hypothetical protein